MLKKFFKMIKELISEDNNFISIVIFAFFAYSIIAIIAKMLIEGFC